jgi:hypothetical protein
LVDEIGSSAASSVPPARWPGAAYPHQETPIQVSAGSLYRKVQRAHNFSTASGLIPDLVVKITNDGRSQWLLIEVKGGSRRSVADSARAATLDLLAYRRAFAPVLDLQTEPYGLGYAWGAGLQPAPGGDVTLCTPDTLPEALAALLP